MLWRRGSTLAVENANSKLVEVSVEESFGDILVIAGLSVATVFDQMLQPHIAASVALTCNLMNESLTQSVTKVGIELLGSIDLFRSMII